MTSGSHELPFLAYNDPDHQRAQRDLNSREGLERRSSTGEDTVLEPFDVATMLAMAQMQADVMPEVAVYKVSC